MTPHVRSSPLLPELEMYRATGHLNFQSSAFPPAQHSGENSQGHTDTDGILLQS